MSSTYGRVSWLIVAAMVGVATKARGQCPPGVTQIGPTTEVITFDDANAADATTTMDGWGIGSGPYSLKLPRYRDIRDIAAGTMGERLVTVVAYNFDRDADGYDDLIALVHEILRPGAAPASVCELRFYRNRGMSGSSHLGFERGVPVLDVNGNPLQPPHCDEEGASLHIGDIDGDGQGGDLLFVSLDDMHGAGLPTRSGVSAYRTVLWRNCPGSGTFPGLGNCNGVTLFPGDRPVFSTPQGSLGNTLPEEMSWHWGADALQLISWNADTTNALSVTDRWDLIWARSTGSAQQVIINYACSPTQGVNCYGSRDFFDAYGFGFNPETTSPGDVAPARKILLDDAGFGGTFAALGSRAAVPSPSCGAAAPSRGITVLLPGDFDQDGDHDLILGSMSETGLRYFENTGDNENPVFTAGTETVIPFDAGGPAYGEVFDYNLDGYPDLAIATDRYSCGGGDGMIYLLRNNGEGRFVDAPVPLADLGNDVDWLLDLDIDGDGDADLLAGRNVAGSPYVIAFTGETNVYHATGRAVSKTLPLSLDPATDSIVSVTINRIDFTGVTPQSLNMWVSNDGGNRWELLSPDELPPNSQPHDFDDFGVDLRWKLEITYKENLSGADARYAPGTTVTPELTEIELTWRGNRGNFLHSRSGLAYGVVDDSGVQREFIYRADTEFEEYKGHLRALEITNCGFSGDVLQSDPCLGSAGWDAADDLSVRSGSDRTVYTAYDASGSGGPIDDRLTLTYSLDPTLQTLLNTNDNDDWRFVVDGMTLSGANSSKLRDIGHSSPVFVGAPPNPADVVCLDPNGSLDFATFAEENAERAPTVYIGANDGMLHAFDALTGAERWGFVPHNLSAKLKTQRGAGNVYRHNFFVDGPVVVREVFDTVNDRWRTVLIGGQARGTGRLGENYFFALDVTDPDDPLPLWEFSDPWDAVAPSCDGDPCDLTCTRTCPTVSCTTTCNPVYSVLTANAFTGATSIQISSSDHPSFPARGMLQINRGTPRESEEVYFIKGGGSTLHIVNALGNPASLTRSYGTGTIVQEAATHVFQETNGMVVIEAERWNRHLALDSTHQWATRSSVTGYTGFGYATAVGSTGNDSPTICDTAVPNSATAPTTCGASLRYSVRFDQPGFWDVYAWVHYDDGDDDSFYWGFNGSSLQKNRQSATIGSWTWVWGHSGHVDNYPPTARIAVNDVGLHTFDLWMRESDPKIDKFVLVRQGEPAPSSGLTGVCEEVCAPVECIESCSQSCVTPTTAEWPECGAGNTCCSVPGSPNQHYCAPVGDNCEGPESVLGETWSPPAIGRFRIAGNDRWLAIFASGYNNRNGFNVGRTVYAVDAVTGQLVGTWEVNDLDYDATSNPSTIDNTIPGGVTLVDMDICNLSVPQPGCGYVDRIYVGDLEGRLWKIDTSADAVLSDGLVDHASWPHCVVFDAGLDVSSGKRKWAPIITKPGAVVLEPGTVNLYFGTGGDDRAPSTELYRFYSVRDSESGTNACTGTAQDDDDLSADEAEWIIGDDRVNSGNPLSSGPLLTAAGLPADYEGTVGDRYWTDPLIVNNAMIIFASVTGSLDAIDICETLSGQSVIYAYAVRRFRDTTGKMYRPGDRILALQAVGKVRQSGIVLGRDPTNLGCASFAAEAPTRPGAGGSGTTPPVAVGGTGGQDNILTSLPTYDPMNRLKILRWREIPL